MTLLGASPLTTAHSDDILHRFRAKLSTCSGPSRPPIPGEAVRIGAGILNGCWTRMDQVWLRGVWTSLVESYSLLIERTLRVMRWGAAHGGPFNSPGA